MTIGEIPQHVGFNARLILTLVCNEFPMGYVQFYTFPQLRPMDRFHNPLPAVLFTILPMFRHLELFYVMSALPSMVEASSLTSTMLQNQNCKPK